jgi:large subunit ribosomal protein L9
MNVILLENINNLGSFGDTASVKAGFARNFLFPQGKAIPATKTNLDDFEGRRAELMAAHDANVGVAQKRKDVVDAAVLRIEVNSSAEGRLFGSVGTRDIAEALNAEKGSDVSKAEVQLPNGAIRDLGEYKVSLDLGYDVQAEITVIVAGLDAAAGVSADGSLIEEIDEAEAEAEAEAAAEEAAVAEGVIEELDEEAVEEVAEEAAAEEDSEDKA